MDIKTIEERASLAAWQIYEEIGLSKHSVDRVSEIIAEKLIEQKSIDIDKACDILSDLGVFDWMADDVPEGFSPEVHKDQFVKCLIEE